MDIRNLLENIDRRKLIASVSIIVLIILGLAVLFGGGKDTSSSNKLPQEGTAQDYTELARVVNGAELFKSVGGDKRYDSLSKDLFVFGQTAFTEYKDASTEVVGFTVISAVEKKDNTVSFSGEYGSSKNKIEVKLELLNNARLKSSITDTVTELNIDQKLPSNSKFNAYISSLPITGDGYTAEYSASDGKIVIQIDDRDPNLSQRAIDDIQKEVDDGSYDKTMIQFIFPPPGGV